MGKKSRKGKHKNKQKEGGAASVGAPSPAMSANAVRSVMQQPPPPIGAACWICLDGDPDGEGKPIVRDCSCRGDDAGFAHLSCLVKYAKGKTREIIQKGEARFTVAWDTCPHCRQAYQRQVAIDMGRSYVSFVDEIYPGIEAAKWKGYNMITYAILNLDYRGNSGLREEGKQSAIKEISVLRGSIEDIGVTTRIMDAYVALGRLAHGEGTKDGFDMALHYYEKVHDWFKSEGDEGGAVQVEAVMSRVKSDRDGGGGMQMSEELLKSFRAKYNESVKKYGEGSPEAVRSGIVLSHALHRSGHGLECERLSNKLTTISRRVCGPDHQITKDAKNIRTLSSERWVAMMTNDGLKHFQALRFSDKHGKYIVKGPISSPRTPDEETTMTVAIDEVNIRQGTPVMCHGLKNAAHLNGEIGDVRDFNSGTDRYVVRFEDKILKPASIKPANLRIVFDLPADENAT